MSYELKSDYNLKKIKLGSKLKTNNSKLIIHNSKLIIQKNEINT
jgi:hypothetical protein